MATVRKVLGQVAPSAASLTTLYTVPAATSTVVSTLTAANTGTAATKFRVAIRVAGAAVDVKDYLYYDVEVGAGDTFAATCGWTLAATDVVSVYATAATVSFALFGEETA